jgi:glycine hydroxymethyltransferase
MGKTMRGVGSGDAAAAAQPGLSRIRDLVASHESWRGSTINLIASEGVISPAVRAALDSDLEGRYADYPGRDLTERRYQGNRYIVEIEEEAAALARTLFAARFVELRPLSGHLAGLAVLMGLCRPGDLVLEVGRDGGGHREAGRLVSAPLARLDVHYLPFDADRYNVDATAAIEMIQAEKPRVVILGSSNFLFPHPIAELVDAVHANDGYLVYDGSHVMGFLAAHKFQDPLAEGADLVFGSTHKTFPGPQGGIIFGDREDLIERVTAALVPALVTNHHPFRIPGMVVALLEMSAFGDAYMDAIQANAVALGEALEQAGVPCVSVDGRFSESHCLLARVAAFGTGAEVALRLEAAGIITTSAHLPPALGTEGVRIGVQEMTRRGADESTMVDIARLFADAVARRRSTPEIAADAGDLALSLRAIHFALT